MKFDGNMYLWPPRAATSTIPFGGLFNRLCNDDKWIAQVKLNGQRNMIYVSPDRSINLWGRHKNLHRNYTAPEWLYEALIDSIDWPDGWVVLDGELLHAKGPEVKDTFYLWDILVWDSEVMLGRTGRERYDLLRDKSNVLNEGPYIDHVHSHIWLANLINGQEGCREAWDADLPLHEGLVFKNFDFKLLPMVTESANGPWQVRSRKPTKSYKF